METVNRKDDKQKEEGTWEESEKEEELDGKTWLIAHVKVETSEGGKEKLREREK